MTNGLEEGIASADSTIRYPKEGNGSVFYFDLSPAYSTCQNTLKHSETRVKVATTKDAAHTQLLTHTDKRMAILLPFTHYSMEGPALIFTFGLHFGLSYKSAMALRVQCG